MGERDKRVPAREVMRLATVYRKRALGEVAAEHFARPARVALGAPMAGMPAGCSFAAFSTAAGMARVVSSPAAASGGGLVETNATIAGPVVTLFVAKQNFNATVLSTNRQKWIESLQKQKFLKLTLK
jgi:hypothetical protein